MVGCRAVGRSAGQGVLRGVSVLWVTLWGSIGGGEPTRGRACSRVPRGAVALAGSRSVSRLQGRKFFGGGAEGISEAPQGVHDGNKGYVQDCGMREGRSWQGLL